MNAVVLSIYQGEMRLMMYAVVECSTQGERIINAVVTGYCSLTSADVCIYTSCNYYHSLPSYLFRYVQVMPGEVCCPTSSRVNVGSGDECCGNIPYSSTGSQICCNGMYWLTYTSIQYIATISHVISTRLTVWWIQTAVLWCTCGLIRYDMLWWCHIRCQFYHQ